MFLHAAAVVADIVVTSHHRLRSVGKSGETPVKRRQNFCATTPTDAICCDYECLLAHFPRQRQCWVVAISCRWLLKSQVAREKTLKFSPPPSGGGRVLFLFLETRAICTLWSPRAKMALLLLSSTSGWKWKLVLRAKLIQWITTHLNR